MTKTGPIIIVEDDKDDREIYEEALQELNIPNELKFFKRCPDAFHYLKTAEENAFLIFCDINLPGQNGLDFKKQIDNDAQLREASIPFVFMSTNSGQQSVKEAYTKMTVQGFFQKPSSIKDYTRHLSLIIDYWKLCRHPNSDL